MLSSEEIIKIKKRDYFSTENSIEKIDHIQSKLVYGNPDLHHPAVTVFIPTFNRPQLLKKAIASVINQKDYDDYLLLIVDDNAASLEQSLENERVIREFNHDRIVYYRNLANIGLIGNWNRCLELAQSKYVSMLHDDDVMDVNHLKTMMKIIEHNDQMKYLGCSHLSLDERDHSIEDENQEFAKNYNPHPELRYYDHFDFNFGNNSMLLGAVFDRQVAIELGGFSMISMIDDYVFVSKFAYHYGVFLYTQKLYGYRWGFNYSLQTDIWQDELIHEYYLYRYINAKRPILTRTLFKVLCDDRILKLVQRHNAGTSYLHVKCNLNPDELITSCQIHDYKSKPYLIRLANYVLKIDRKLRRIRKNSIVRKIKLDCIP